MVVSFYFACNLYCDIFDYYYKHMYTLYMAVRSVCFKSVNLLILIFLHYTIMYLRDIGVIIFVNVDV